MSHDDDQRQPGSSSSVQALWRIPQWFPDLNETVLETLKKFHDELVRYNTKINLIGRATERDSDEVHFADSVLGGRLILSKLTEGTIYDIGSGNGLPGVALAIMKPGLKVVLLESDTRKSEFLKHVVHLLGLSDIEVMNQRLESLPPGSISAGVSRGFASLTKAVLLGNRVFGLNSQYFHMKTSTWSREVAEIPSQVCSTWSPELVGEYALPASQARRAVVCTTKIG